MFVSNSNCRILMMLLAGLVWMCAIPAVELRADDPPAEAETDEDVKTLQDAAAASLHAAEEEAGGADHGHGDEHGHDEHSHVHVGAPLGEPDPAELRSDLAIYTFLVFLVLFGVLWRFAWGPIVTGLEKREQGIAANIEEARRCRDEAKLLLQQYEAKLAEAQNEVREILDEARRDAEHTQQEILANARAEADRERKRSLNEIETATAQALKQLAERSTNLAVDLAGKIVRAQLNPEDHNRLINEAVNQFVEAGPSQN